MITLLNLMILKNSVIKSVDNSVWNSVNSSVWDSVRDSVDKFMKSYDDA